MLEALNYSHPTTCLNSHCLCPNYWIYGTTEWPHNVVFPQRAPTGHRETPCVWNQACGQHCSSPLWLVPFSDLIDWRANSNEGTVRWGSWRCDLTNLSFVSHSIKRKPLTKTNRSRRLLYEWRHEMHDLGTLIELWSMCLLTEWNTQGDEETLGKLKGWRRIRRQSYK